MAFINSWFLWALLALLVPVIIHLFHFRRYKKVLFTNVRFLKELKEEQNARRKLRNLLVLATRILALAFLILGFAQPFLVENNNVDLSNKNVGIFIDNSQSMASLSKDIPLLDKAKAKARDIVNTYGEQELFQILTNDFEGRHQRLLTKEDALSMIEEISITPKAQKLTSVLQRHQQILKGTDRTARAYLISDFQQTINDLENYTDTSMVVDLLSLQSVQEKNISVDTAWLEAKVPMINENNELIFKITNHGNERAENVKLSLIQQGQNKPVGSLNIEANSTVVDTVNIALTTTGWQKLELKVSDYPITFDDSYYMSFEVSDEIKTLAINENSSNKYLNSVFDGMPYHSLDNVPVNRIDYSKFSSYKLIVLNDVNNITSGLATELENFILAGGNVLCFLSKNLDKNAYNSFLNRMAADEIVQKNTQEKEVSRINEDEFIFNEVFEKAKTNRQLPKSQVSYKLTSYQNRDRDILLANRDASAYLLKYSRQEGHLYVCTSPLDIKENDLAINAEIFVPMLYKMSISSQTTEDMALTIGKDNIITVPNNTDDQEMTYVVKGEEEFIPGQRRSKNTMLLDINNQIKKAGYYDISLANKTIKTVAYNYDRIESNLNTTSNDDLSYNNPKVTLLNDNQAANLAQIITEKDRGKQLWKWCLIFALIFLGIETLLLRFWKA